MCKQFIKEMLPGETSEGSGARKTNREKLSNGVVSGVVPACLILQGALEYKLQHRVYLLALTPHPQDMETELPCASPNQAVASVCPRGTEILSISRSLGVWVKWTQ